MHFRPKRIEFGPSRYLADAIQHSPREESAKGQPIYYGDATREAVLQHAGIKYATVLVVAIPDAAATERITKLARDVNPKLHIIIRTRLLQEMERLYKLGANEVIPEEFETSVEIFARVLAKFNVPRDRINALISEVRSDGYQMLRTLSLPSSDSAEPGDDV